MTQKKAFAARPRSHRLIWGLSLILIVASAAWISGLLWFISLLPTSVTDPTRGADAIVVLTGGRGRIQQGLDLLAAQRAKKLFISGVYRGVDVEQLLRISRQSPARLSCCVALGYEADDTKGNAVETAGWMKEQGLNSLRLVTSAYHMPRSLIEFRRIMPETEIIPHPVFPDNFDQQGWWSWPGSAGLIVSEYGKYLIALFRNTIFGAAR